MSKFCAAFLLLIAFSETAFSMNEESLGGNPVRRAPAMLTRSAELARLTSDIFVEKLEAMVVCYSEGKHGVTFRQIKRLITQNPDNANPYIAKYDAHLITLASRWGMLDVVQTIAENNQSSIHSQGKAGQVDANNIFTCYGAYTPLDEAVAFGQKEVAAYLFKLDAPMYTVARADLHRLVDRPNKKRKR